MGQNKNKITGEIPKMKTINLGKKIEIEAIEFKYKRPLFMRTE